MMTGVLSVVISVVISTNAVLSASVYQRSGKKKQDKGRSHTGQIN